MKKAIFILMLIAATLAVKKSSAQARLPVVKSPIIRAAAPVKSLGITNHHVSPPPLTRLGPAKVMANTIPIVITNGNGSVTATTTTNNPDGSRTSSSTTYNTDGSTTSSSTTYNPDNSIRSTTPLTTTPATTTDPGGTRTQPINKTSSDQQLPQPITIPIDNTHSVEIIFVWSGAGGS